MITPRRERVHDQIHFYCLALMAVGLPLSMFLMSVSSIFLAANWLVWGNFKTRFQTFISNKPAWIFSLIFLMHIIGGLYSTDMAFYLDDLKIKLPLLVYPIILGSVPILGEKKSHLLMWIFSGALLSSALVSFAIFFGFTSVTVNDFRDLSPFISHIRLSLLTCVGIVWFFLTFLKADKWLCKAVFLTAAVFLLCLLNILQSITGFGIISILFVLFIASFAWKLKNTVIKWAVVILVFSVPPLYVGLKGYEYISSQKPLGSTTLHSKTVNGMPYEHLTQYYERENGNLVFVNLAYPELQREWKKRSLIHYDSLTTNSHGTVIGCLVRYMASKGLNKDSAGIWSLSQKDINAIENGATNYKYIHNGIEKRIYAVFQELDSYLNGSVNGSSSTQRIEYVKTGYRIFKQHPLFGVGTGDLAISFEKQYELDNSPLTPENRLRAHNQYLSILIGFGVVGMLVFLAGILIPAIINNTFKSRLFVAWLVVALISFLSEDTLETQAGVSFFMFFYGLFVWCNAKKFD